MLEKAVATPYALIGGEIAVLTLVERFYFYMDSLPAAAPLRKIHADDLSGARDKLFKFLSGWLGGPDLFIQEFGHPRLRQRHIHFAIGEAEVEQWLFCMHKAMDEITMESTLRDNLWQALTQLAQHMINQSPNPE